MAENSSSVGAWLLGTACTGGTLCAGALLLLYMFQDRLLYFPTIPGTSKFTRDNPRGYRHPGEFGIEYDDLMIPATDGVHVHAWLMKQPEAGACPTLIFFHGNAGNIGYRLPNAVQLYRKIGVNILLVDYRGFGHSEGEPSEHGIKLDAKAALTAMHERTDIDTSKLVLFGRSLGGAVSIYLAAQEPTKVAAVVLENTFLSISSMVDALMPVLSYVKPLVLRMEWNSELAIQKLPHPILFIAGMQDELVPHFHMERLRTLAKASRRAMWYPVPGGTHNDSWLRGGDKYFAELRRFLDGLGGGPVNAGSETCSTSDLANGDSSEGIFAEENAIPNMLQQPLIGAVHKAQKPKAE